MGDNANEAMFMAAYIFIFIIALSATITMFYMINNYADLSYEYGKNVEDIGIIENVPVTSYRLINGSQLISYYYNYIDGIKNSTIVYNYKIKINTLHGEEILKLNSDLMTAGASYDTVLKLCDPKKMYYLKYEKKAKDVLTGKYTIDISINELTENEKNKLYE